MAVVLGGGTGTRFGGTVPKQLLTLGGKTLVEHCVAAFAAVPATVDGPGIDEIVLVMPAAYHDEARRLVGPRVSAIIEGGTTRSDLGPQRPGPHRRAVPASTSTRRPHPRRGPAAGHPADHRRLRPRAWPARRDRHRGPVFGHHLVRRRQRDHPRTAAGNALPRTDPAGLPPVGHRGGTPPRGGRSAFHPDGRLRRRAALPAGRAGARRPRQRAQHQGHLSGGPGRRRRPC